MRRRLTGELGDQVVQNVATDIGETEITTTISIGEFGVIDAHEIQDSCMNVVDMNRLFHRLETEFVSRAVDCSALDCTA